MASSAHAKYLSKLPVDWERVPVRALGTVHAGGTPSRDIPRYWNGTIHWVTPAEITKLESKYLSKTNECITYEGLACCAAKLLPEGSLLVTTRATIGGVAVSKLPVCTNQGFKNIVLNEMSNVNFYYHLFSIIVPELSRLASGSTFPEINQRNFETIIVPMPSKEEQRRIAEILDTIDEAIQKTEALISKLKAMKQGLLHDLLTRGLNKNGKLRDPKAHPEQFNDSPLGRIPREWILSRIISVSSIKYGISDAIDQTLIKGVPTITLPCVSPLGELTLDKNLMALTEPGKLSPYDFLQPGDLLFNWRNGSREHLGKTAYYNGNGEHTHVGFLLRVRSNPDMCKSRYLWWLLCFMKAKGFFLAAKGQVNNTFNSSELANVRITLPSINEQMAIDAVLESHDSRIRTEEQYRDKLKLQKKGLMHDLLTGRVRVKV